MHQLLNLVRVQEVACSPLVIFSWFLMINNWQENATITRNPPRWSLSSSGMIEICSPASMEWVLWLWILFCGTLLLSLWLWMSCVSLVQDYSVSLYLQYEFISGLSHFEFWSFSTGVSLTKYPTSTIAYCWLKNQPRHHV
jgi:hypothetical protein